jgi:SAM-dependent methyltransferase
LPEEAGLEFTGERVVPGLVDPNLLNEHLARYRFAALFARGASVLDAGCGSGYGSAELSCAASIAAMDIAHEAVVHARGAYPGVHTRFLQGRCESLPFADGVFDLVVAFEVIEHLERWQDLLAEARRVLRPAGVLLVSTPNKAFYAESRDKAGPNPFHVHEFEYAEFDAALKVHFPHVHLWTQNHAEAISLVPAQASHGTFDAPGDDAPEKASFFVAACSQSPIARNEAFGWLATSGNVLRERQRHIALLEAEIAKKNRWLAEAERAQALLQAEFDREVEKASQVVLELREEIKTARAGYEKQIARNEHEAAAKLQWIAGLEEQIGRGNAEISRQRAEIDELGQTLASRTDWAHSLNREMEEERAAYRSLEQQHLETLESLRKVQAELEHTRSEHALTEATRWVRFGRGLGLMRPKSGEPRE